MITQDEYLHREWTDTQRQGDGRVAADVIGVTFHHQPTVGPARPKPGTCVNLVHQTGTFLWGYCGQPITTGHWCAIHQPISLDDLRSSS